MKFSTLKITESNFPQVQKEQVREVTDEITRAIPDRERIIGLDRVLAGVDTSKIIPREVKGLKAEPPAIFYSETPAVLMNLDGEPIWSQIANNDLKYAVNTNWDLFLHEPTQDVLPAPQRKLAEGGGGERAVGGRGQAPRQLQQAAGRRQLEGSQGGVAGQDARRRGRCRRCMSARCRRS